MKTTIKVNDTRYPKLTRAILRHLNREQLEDVARHGADSGWPGFIYYTDTVAFFKAHKSEIIALAESTSREFGSGGMLEMIAGFRCLNKAYSIDEVGEAIYSGRGEASQSVRNAMAWFALEEVARELNPEI